jgi:hypothetical protein
MNGWSGWTINYGVTAPTLFCRFVFPSPDVPNGGSQYGLLKHVFQNQKILLGSQLRSKHSFFKTPRVLPCCVADAESSHDFFMCVFVSLLYLVGQKSTHHGRKQMVVALFMAREETRSRNIFSTLLLAICFGTIC